MEELSFITGNPDKYEEMRRFFKERGMEVRWIERSLPEIQARSLEEVVAHALSQVEERHVFVEDAGLFIDVLNGFPGVYSRYVFETLGNKGILKLLEGVERREARFEAVIGYKDGDGRIKIFKGEVRGLISHAELGCEGFGYDPIFVPLGHDKTFGEDARLKSALSHRRRAAERFIRYLERS